MIDPGPAVTFRFFRRPPPPTAAVLALALAAFPAAAAPFGADADECAIQQALLGKAGPGCPPPAPPAPPPVAPAVAPPFPVPRPASAPPPAPPSIPPTPAPAVAPAPPPPAVTPPVVAGRADFLILFDFGSDRVSGDSEKLLTRIAAVLNAPAAAGARFRIIGHTDNVGSDAANLALSRRRAAAVMAWLIRHGVAAHRLESLGEGENRPADPAHPAAAANRRVEIVTLPGR